MIFVGVVSVGVMDFIAASSAHFTRFTRLADPSAG
jgi:hypothetical protein